MDFEQEVRERVASNAQNEPLKDRVYEFLAAAIDPKYSCSLSWLRLPIIHCAKDIVTMRELSCRLQPGLIIDTGIAHGGFLILCGSLMDLTAAYGGPAAPRCWGSTS